MLIYAPHISERFRYIARFLIGQVTDVAYEFTTDRYKVETSDIPCVVYDQEPFSTESIWIKPAGLLEEKGIRVQEISCDNIKDFKILFPNESALGFDIFSAAFYLLSRYEEYLPHQKDMYGRYAHENSIAYREGFLHQPLINVWIHHFRLLLAERFPGLKLRQASFHFIPTYDIDIAWSFKHKPAIINIGAFAKALLKGDTGKIKQMSRVLTNRELDPYDCYAWLHQLHQHYQLRPIYFFHVGEKRGKYDRNISPAKPPLQNLIKEHADQYQVGIHPSWQSGDQKNGLQSEKMVLENIIQQKVIYSRQHYIRFNLPATYRQLLQAGIMHDYSMGYGSINGFRASVASPFWWYDLEQEKQTDLLVQPFCFMDANAFYEQKMTPNDAMQELRDFTNILKQTGGHMITIWHNNFLGTDTLFNGWKEIYREWIHDNFNE